MLQTDPVGPGSPAACRVAAGLGESVRARARDTGIVSGAAEIGFAPGGGGATRLAYLYQHNPLRVLFPAAEPGDAAALAVLVTTSGGLVAGDRLAIDVRLASGALAHVTAAAAEKIYRSPGGSPGGATTQIVQSFMVDSAGWLEYLPLETILFDGARLRRHTTVMLMPGAGFLGGGIIVFGRRARGERFTRGLLHDRVEICRDGALVWGDALHLGDRHEGGIAALMGDPACLDAAAACASLVLAPPGAADPGRFIDGARTAQQQHSAPAGAGLRAGLTAVNGVLVARWLGRDPLPLRRAFAALAGHLREAAMGLPARLPRLWTV